jgi:hypothetical protein
MTKSFRIAAADIRELAPGRGGCYASDKITVEGARVGWMYRESDELSGWAFFAGTESQDYADDPTNFEIYDVNTIANYDPSIIPFLDAPDGSAFERAQGSGEFVPIADWVPPSN